MYFTFELAQDHCSQCGDKRDQYNMLHMWDCHISNKLNQGANTWIGFAHNGRSILGIASGSAAAGTKPRSSTATFEIKRLEGQVVNVYMRARTHVVELYGSQAHSEFAHNRCLIEAFCPEGMFWLRWSQKTTTTARLNLKPLKVINMYNRNGRWWQKSTAFNVEVGVPQLRLTCALEETTKLGIPKCFPWFVGQRRDATGPG